MPQNNDLIVRKPFNLQEAVVLLDDYLRGVESGMSNWDIAEVASQHLRNLANERGMTVDDSFRSPVGLQNRLRSIAHIYAGTESASAPATKVFQEAVSLYKNDRMTFDSLLSASNDLRRESEKKDMKIQPNLEQDFFSWLKKESSPQICDEVQRLYPSINTMLMQKKALNQPLLLTTQAEQIEALISKVKTYFGNKRIPQSADMKDIAQLLEQSGFTVMYAEANRISLNKGYTENGFADKVYHIHLRYAGDNDELYFRDYLNEHPAVAKEYETLKLRLWKQYEHDRDAYTDAKTDFISKWTAEARKEYGDRY